MDEDQNIAAELRCSNYGKQAVSSERPYTEVEIHSPNACIQNNPISAMNAIAE
jgi:hypothetical protein